MMLDNDFIKCCMKVSLYYYTYFNVQIYSQLYELNSKKLKSSSVKFKISNN